MAQEGKFVWKDRSAILGYTVQGDYCYIYGPDAQEFFWRVPHDEEFELHQKNGEVLRLLRNRENPPDQYTAFIQRKP
jgi:hypothetical protein